MFMRKFARCIVDLSG